MIADPILYVPAGALPPAGYTPLDHATRCGELADLLEDLIDLTDPDVTQPVTVTANAALRAWAIMRVSAIADPIVAEDWRAQLGIQLGDLVAALVDAPDAPDDGTPDDGTLDAAINTDAHEQRWRLERAGQQRLLFDPTEAT